MVLEHKISILVATSRLSKLSGTETFTFTLIEELVKRNELEVEYFTFEKGIVSDRIEKLGVSFMSEKKYDLILANHYNCVNHLFGRGTIIQTIHGIFPDLEKPSLRADLFVSISSEIQNHLATIGIPSTLIFNGINLSRFFPKSPISKNLNTVLSLCQSNFANNKIEEICKSLGLTFIKASKYENATWKVEDLINKADLVFGLGRSAYEAISCGRPVIIYDEREYMKSFADGYIADFIGSSILNNCSGRYLKLIFNEKEIIDELQKYNFEDTFKVRAFAEQNLDITSQVNKYLNLFSEFQSNSRSRGKFFYFNLIRLLLGIKFTKLILKWFR